MAIKVWKKTTKTAPKTNNNALSLPSFTLTFAAVILIKPGKIVPNDEAKKPKKSGKI